MIISRTPLRISLVGGGTDMRRFFSIYGGAVIGGTINRYVYVTCKKRDKLFKNKYRISYAKIEEANSIDAIENRAVQATLEYLRFDEPLDIHYIGDIPSAGGLASSSAFIVGLLNCLYTMKQESVSRIELAQAAIKIEREILKEKGGYQDQIWAANGGFNLIEFEPDHFKIRPILNGLSVKAIERHSKMYYTNISRQAGVVTNTYKKDSRSEGRLLKNLTYRALEAIENNRINELGDILNEGWSIKKQFGGVSNDKIDEIYEAGMKAGAVGGKLLGAGGGGTIFFLCPPEKHQQLDAALSEYSTIPFSFTNTGTEIIFHE